MTTVVLAGFFLMLFAPCVFAIYGGRDKKAKKAIAASYEDRAVNRTPERAAEEDELDIPRRREEFLVQSAPPVAVAPAVPSSPVPVARHEEPAAYRRSPSLKAPNLQGIVEQAESEALAAHAMAAQANAAALAATARAAQARAQAAAEMAIEAKQAAANHAAAVREAQRYAEASESAMSEQPELPVPVSSKNRSRRAA